MNSNDRISQLDTTLFRYVLSQTTEDDKRSLLAIQTAVRNLYREYVYLEIGSFQGGSLQPYVIDPCCRKIISIDPRPASVPDSRGIEKYQDNSSERMLSNLRSIPGANVEKIQTIEAGTDTADPQAISVKPDLCLIDGEHTDAAALRDARFCLSVVQPNGCLVFHDANLIYGALDLLVKELRQAGRPIRPYLLPDSLFVLDLGESGIGEMEPVRSRRADNYQAYLAGMKANDWYRQAYHLPIYRFLRRVRRMFPRS